MTGGSLWRSLGRSPTTERIPAMIIRNITRASSLAAFAAGALFLSGLALNAQAQVQGPTPAADLGVTKFGDVSQVPPDSDVTYTITVTNSGPDAAIDAELEDTLPGNMTFVSSRRLPGGPARALHRAPVARSPVRIRAWRSRAARFLPWSATFLRGRPRARSTRTRRRSARARLIPMGTTIVPAP